MANTSSKSRKTAGLDIETVGVDLGDRYSHYCILDSNGDIVEEGRFRTTREGVATHFQGTPRRRVAMEAGTHSAWVSRLIAELGHEVIVADPSKTRFITHSNKKNDRVDAKKLARFARVDPELLNPIEHRSEDAQKDLAMIRVRERLVAARSMLVNAARGLVKSFGKRLPSCAIEGFPTKARAAALPADLMHLITPLLDQITSLTAQVRSFDQAIEKLADSKYLDTVPLRSIKGVGALTAVSFVLTLGDKHRFAKSRDVGCYVGLRPKQSQSGERDPQLSITKAGDSFLRKTLVQCAQYILGPFGPDTALRRWGLRLAERGGKNAKKRAIVAVARKLAVLLHRLWVTQRLYEPFYGVQSPAVR